MLILNAASKKVILIIKGIVHPKMKTVVTYSPSWVFKPVWVSFFLLNTKEHILKNVGNQSVEGSHW